MPRAATMNNYFYYHGETHEFALLNDPINPDDPNWVMVKVSPYLSKVISSHLTRGLVPPIAVHSITPVIVTVIEDYGHTRDTQIPYFNLKAKRGRKKGSTLPQPETATTPYN